MSFSYLAVFGAGLATFLSPCVLPLIPILTANLISTSQTNRWAKLLSTLWFGIGFTIAFILMGLGISAFVEAFPNGKFALLVLSAIILGFFGLKMGGFIDRESKIGMFTRSFQMPVFLRKLPGGLHGLFLGAGFGLSWTPCVGPILGGVLTYVATAERSTAEGTLLLLSFSLGIVLPLLAVAFAADTLLPRLRKLNRFTPKIEALAGYGLVFFSVYTLNQAYLNIPNESSAPTAESKKIESAQNHSAKMCFFFSDHCPICHAMEGFLPRVESDCRSNSFALIRVNVNQVENAALVAKYNVRAVPTVSVLDPQGSEMIHLIGYQTEGRLREAAKAASHLECTSRDSNPNNQNKIQNHLLEGETCGVGNRC